jgi:hypothetical protein
VRLGQPGLIAALAALAVAAAGCGGGGGGSDTKAAQAPTITGTGPAAKCARAWNSSKNQAGQTGLAQWIGTPGLSVQIGIISTACQLILTDDAGELQVWTEAKDGGFRGPAAGTGAENALHPLDVTSAGLVLLSS